MPQESYEWLPRADLLSFEEIGRLAAIFTRLGADKLRITGGEPLLRSNLATLIRMLASNERARDIAMTTNGVLLAENASLLRAAGLTRVTVSLDTLRPERFEELTRRSLHDRVLRGIESLASAGFDNTKIDSVVIRGRNDDELADLIEYGRTVDAEVRFIEYMDVGGATHWSYDQVVSRAAMLRRLEERYGRIEPIAPTDAAPAERFRLSDGTTFGIIASTTAPFCRTCDRSRLTADGLWYLCLYAPRGTDLRGPLRDGASDDEIMHIIDSIWSARRDRGAEVRASMPERAALVGIERLKRDPHLEMHTRGG
jgi:cyclic pyranopterin phosphate synthase